MKKLALILACLIALTLPVAAGAATITRIMSGLDNPRGLAFGSDGALYVVEGGRGGSGPCITIMGAQQCVGLTGAVSQLASLGHQARVVTGLPSLAVASGSDASGPSDISFRGGSAYVTLGLGTDPARRSQLGSFGSFFGHLIRLTPSGRFDVADIAGWERSTNPMEARSTPTPMVSLLSQIGSSSPTPAGTT